MLSAHMCRLPLACSPECILWMMAPTTGYRDMGEPDYSLSGATGGGVHRGDDRAPLRTDVVRKGEPGESGSAVATVASAPS